MKQYASPGPGVPEALAAVKRARAIVLKAAGGRKGGGYALDRMVLRRALGDLDTACLRLEPVVAALEMAR